VDTRIRLATVYPAQIRRFGTRAGGVGAVTAESGEPVRCEEWTVRVADGWTFEKMAATHSNQNPAGMIARHRKITVLYACNAHDGPGLTDRHFPEGPDLVSGRTV
jgi:hypothetical protein